MNIRSILLAADFSQPAKAAACDARLLAGHFGVRLTVLHVLPYPLAIPGAPQYGMKLGEWFTGRAEEDAVELRSFFAAELKDADVHVAVLEGDPAGRIVEYAVSNGVDLIVMPAYGQGPFRRLLLGSVTAKVLHDVDCPVWTGIHREQLPCSERLDIKTVVCATGLEPQDEKLARWASRPTGTTQRKRAGDRPQPAVGDLRPVANHGLCHRPRLALPGRQRVDSATNARISCTYFAVRVMMARWPAPANVFTLACG